MASLLKSRDPIMIHGQMPLRTLLFDFDCDWDSHRVVEQEQFEHLAFGPSVLSLRTRFARYRTHEFVQNNLSYA